MCTSIMAVVTSIQTKQLRVSVCTQLRRSIGLSWTSHLSQSPHTQTLQRSAEYKER